jgi:hypothetical protein
MSSATRGLAFPLQLPAPETRPSRLYRGALAVLTMFAASPAWLTGPALAREDNPNILIIWGADIGWYNGSTPRYRGLGGKYLIVGPGYYGPLPEGGYFIAQSRTNRVLYAARSFLVDNDPKPAVENIKANMKIYPYVPGSYGTSIAAALEGEVRLAPEPEIPETKFVEGSGVSFNTIPPSDYGFFDDQRERLR